jgi:hypothetical protein
MDIGDLLIFKDDHKYYEYQVRQGQGIVIKKQTDHPHFKSEPIYWAFFFGNSYEGYAVESWWKENYDVIPLKD